MNEPEIHIEQPTPEHDVRGVRLWYAREGVEVHFTIKGCIDVRIFSNGAQPGDESPADDNVDYVHICDMPKFIEMMTDALATAKPLWRPI